MDTIVRHIGLLWKAQLLPLVFDGASQGAGCGGLWIRGTEHILAESFPRELLLIPLHIKDLDPGTGPGVSVAHGHVEAVDHIEWRARRRRSWCWCWRNVTTVEAAAKLDKLLVRLTAFPELRHLHAVNLHVLAGVHGILDHALLQRILPSQAESALERLQGLVTWIGLVWSEQRSLGCNGAIVLVDEFLFVDVFAPDAYLAQDLDTRTSKLFLYELGHRITAYAGVRLHEHHCTVFGA